MPVKTVECAICGQAVTKRSSLSLTVLGGGDGRACRTHEIVTELVEADKKETQLKREFNEIDRILRIQMGAAFIRTMHTMFGVHPSSLYRRMQYLQGYKPDMIDAIKVEVEKLGGPMMTTEEQLMTVISSMEMMKRGVA